MDTRLLLVVATVAAAACDDGAVATAAPTDAARLVVHDFDVWNLEEWPPIEESRGRGALRAGAVSHGDGRLIFEVGGGGFDGGAVLSAVPWDLGAVNVRLRAPRLPGAAAVVMLTNDPVADERQAVALELLGDGTRGMRIVAWRGGDRIGAISHAIPFDATADFHDFQIHRVGDQVAFAGANRFFGSVGFAAEGPVRLIVGAWFPEDLRDPLPIGRAFLAVDAITLRPEG